MSTIAQVDQALLTACTAYANCLDHGDLDGADQAYARLDELLEERLHLPQPRQPS